MVVGLRTMSLVVWKASVKSVSTSSCVASEGIQFGWPPSPLYG